MITDTSTKEEIVSAIGEAVSDMGGLIAKLDETQVNTVPFADSWTAGQVASHVTKSINGLAGAIAKEFVTTDRDPGEKIAGLRDTFLNFSNKFNSPDFILPGDGPFEKQACINALQQAFELLQKNSANIHLNELLTGMPMGDVTKLELLHFLLYHTQRHLHQLKNITAALQSK